MWASASWGSARSRLVATRSSLASARSEDARLQQGDTARYFQRNGRSCRCRLRLAPARLSRGWLTMHTCVMLPGQAERPGIGIEQFGARLWIVVCVLSSRGQKGFHCPVVWRCEGVARYLGAGGRKGGSGGMVQFGSSESVDVKSSPPSRLGPFRCSGAWHCFCFLCFRSCRFSRCSAIRWLTSRKRKLAPI